ncbi:hypothetical protein V1279_005025 [Bradyrhizobium sp. AZCC 1610]
MPTHDPLAGAVADIGIQKARSHAVQTEDLDHPGQWLRQAPQRCQLFVREPTGLFGGPARCIHRAADEGQWQREIIRDAFGAKFVDNRKTTAPEIIGAGPNLQPLLEHNDQRAGVKIRRLQDVVVDRANLDLGARLPDETAPVNFGMQGSNEDADTPQRQPRRDHPFAALGHKSLGAGRGSPAIHQPVGQLSQS